MADLIEENLTTEERAVAEGGAHPAAGAARPDADAGTLRRPVEDQKMSASISSEEAVDFERFAYSDGGERVILESYVTLMRQCIKLAEKVIAVQT